MINENINIISFISDIVFENIQMQKKMVWYKKAKFNSWLTFI